MGWINPTDLDETFEKNTKTETEPSENKAKKIEAEQRQKRYVCETKKNNSQENNKSPYRIQLVFGL